MISTHPFRSRRLSGGQVGWFRPAAAVLLAMVIPAALVIGIILNGGPTFSGPPQIGIGYSFADHIALVLACLSASVVVSWIMAPFALFALRAAAMLGWAGWGSAIATALIIGLPIAHFTLNGDLTTEENAILPHITVAIAFLGLSVWAAFWCLIRWAEKSPNFANK